MDENTGELETPKRRRRRKAPQPVVLPNLHFVMIVGVLFLLVLFSTLYMFAPGDKANLFGTSITALLAFFFGKLTNGFGKPMDVSAPSVPAMAQDDDDHDDDTNIRKVNQ